MATEIRRMALRRGTASEWTSANPVLAAGEEGYETDTGKRKVGDGVTAWATLAYNGASVPDTVVESLDIDNIDQVTQAEYDAIDPKDPRTLYVIV